MNSKPAAPSRQFSDQALVLIPLYAIIFLLAVVGNSLVMVTLLQNKRMRTPMNVLLLNLAISDLLLGVVCMPFTLTGFLLRDFIFGAILCRVIPYLQAVSVSVSAYTLVTISFERYFGICYPLRTRHWRSLSHAYKMISVVWISSFLFTIPIAVTSQLQPLKNSGRHKCREEWPTHLSEQIFNMFLDVILLIVPLFLMATLYFKISRALWQHIINEREPKSDSPHSSRGESAVLAVSAKSSCSRRIIRNSRKSTKKSESRDDASELRGSNPNLPQESDVTIGEGKVEWEKSSMKCKVSKLSKISLEPSRKNTFLRKSNTKKSLQNKKRIIKMLFVVVLEFFICWAPLHIINTVSLFDPYAVYGVLGMGGVSAFQLLAYCSSCCNPITYCFMNASFRRAFLSAVGCKRETSNSQCDEMQIYTNNK